MQQLLAFVAGSLSCQDLAALPSEFADALGELWSELAFQLQTQLLRQGRALAACRNGDLQVATSDHRGKIEIAIGWVVDYIAEHAMPASFGINFMIDFRRGSCGDHKVLISDVAGYEAALVPLNPSFLSPCRDDRSGRGCDHMHAGAGMQET